MNRKLTMILPTYNEALNIRPLIEAIYKEKADIHEIIVVDDDSPDGTSGIVQEMIDSRRYPFLKLEKRLADHGLTKSIQRGIELSTGDMIGWMDCDFSMPPECIPILAGMADNHYDIAVGSRFVTGASWIGEERDPNDTILGVVLSRLMNLFIQFSLDYRFRDYTSGFVVARKEIFDKIKLRGDYGEYFIEFIYRALKSDCRIIEVPYKWVPRRAGYSKTGDSLSTYLKCGRKYIAVAIRLLVTMRICGRK